MRVCTRMVQGPLCLGAVRADRVDPNPNPRSYVKWRAGLSAEKHQWYPVVVAKEPVPLALSLKTRRVGEEKLKLTPWLLGPLLWPGDLKT